MLVGKFRFGSFADPHDTPKAAVRPAGIDGIAELAIHGKQLFVSGKFWDQREMPSGKYWPMGTRSVSLVRICVGHTEL